MAPYAANTTRPVPIERGARRNSISPIPSPSSSRSNPVIILDKKPIYTGCTFTCPSSESKKRGWRNASQSMWNKTQEELSKLAKRRYEKGAGGRRDVTDDIALKDLPVEAQYQVEDWVDNKNDAEPDPELYEWQVVMIKQKGGLFGNRNAIDVILKRSIRADLRDGHGASRRRNSRTVPRTRSFDDLRGSGGRRRSFDEGIGAMGHARGSADDMMARPRVGQALPRDFPPQMMGGPRGPQPGVAHGMAQPDIPRHDIAAGVPGPRHEMGGMNRHRQDMGPGMQGPRHDMGTGMNVPRPDIGAGVNAPRFNMTPGIPPPRHDIGGPNMAPGMGPGMGHGIPGSMPHAPQPPSHGHRNVNNMHDNIQIVNSDSESDDGEFPMPNGPRPGPAVAMPQRPPVNPMPHMPQANPHMAQGAGMPHAPQTPMPPRMGMPHMAQARPVTMAPGMGVPHPAPSVSLDGRPSPVNAGMPPQMQQPMQPLKMDGMPHQHQKPTIHQMIPKARAPKRGQKHGKTVVQHEVYSDDESVVTSSSGDCTVRTPRTSSSFGEEVPCKKKNWERSGERIYREHRRRRSSERRDRRPSDSGYVVVGERPRRTSGVGPTVLRRDSFEDDRKQYTYERDRRERNIDRMRSEIRDNELRQREREYERALRNRDERKHQEKLEEIDRKLTRLALEERDDRQGNYERGPGARYGGLTREDHREFGTRERDMPRDFGFRDRDVARDIPRDLPRDFGMRERDFGASPKRSTFRQRDIYDEVRSPVDDDLRSGYSGSYGRRFDRRRDDMFRDLDQFGRNGF